MFDVSAGQNLSASGIVVAAYLAAFLLLRSKSLIPLTLAALASQAFGLSPAYIELWKANPAAIFVVYSSIYMALTMSIYISLEDDVRRYRIMISCFAMVIFMNLTNLAFKDGLINEGVSDFVYQSYELVTAFLHVVIVLSVVDWRKAITSLYTFHSRLLQRWVHNYMFLPY